MNPNFCIRATAVLSSALVTLSLLQGVALLALPAHATADTALNGPRRSPSAILTAVPAGTASVDCGSDASPAAGRLHLCSVCAL